ncbi:MAG: PmbA protein [Thermoproteota archaeon]|nr:PmbA protein [Thermoproteota archaeon]
MSNATDTIMELAKKYNVDQSEAYYSKNKLITIRMAVNEIAEAKSLVTEGISVRLIVANSIGFASSTELTREAFKKIVETAYHIAKSKKPDPDFKSLPTPKRVEEFKGSFDEELNDLEVEEAVKYGSLSLRAGKEVDPKIDFSGSINVISEECNIVNSLGIDASDASTFIYSSITAEKGEEASGIGQTCSKNKKDFEPVKATRDAAETCLKSVGGRGIKPGRYDVIFGPDSCAELTEYILSYGLDLSAVEAGFSYFRGKLGGEVASDSLTLSDDGRHPEGIASKKVDDEGVPTQRTELIKNGVLRNFLCDTYYSNKLSSSVREFESTGNGFRFGAIPGRSHSSVPRIQPTNFVIKEGRDPLDELIENTKKGILVGRIWYTYPINPTVGEFSTTNRGNTFYIEEGAIKYPLLPNSFRINDSLPKLLKRISGISKEATQSVVWGGISSCISPHIKVQNVEVTYSKED